MTEYEEHNRVTSKLTVSRSKPLRIERSESYDGLPAAVMRFKTALISTQPRLPMTFLIGLNPPGLPQ